VASIRFATVSSQVRIPVFVVLIATLVTLVDMATECLAARPVQGARPVHRPDRRQLRHPRAGRGVCLEEQACSPRQSTGWRWGWAFTGALTLIGLIRELLGAGTAVRAGLEPAAGPSSLSWK
jgi:electron transport complex protein RnfE